MMADKQLDENEAADAVEPAEELEAVSEDGAEAEELDELSQLQQEVADLRDTMLRQRADFENIRKRLRREAEEAGNRAIARFVRPILEELDNFQRALLAANPEQFQDFAMGVTMIKSNLEGTLNSAGIEQIPTEGVFDPAVHEVISEVEVADQPRGTIVDVARSGYKLGNQVIRAAQVIVSRPPAASEAAADDADDAAE